MRQLLNISFIILLLIGFGDVADERPKVTYEMAQVIFEQHKYVAGELIKLEIKGGRTSSLLLFVQSSYGSSVLTPVFIDGVSSFVFPAFLSEKSGLINWKLSDNRAVVLSGTMEVFSDMSNAFFMETYCGPPSLQVGETDFSMLVAIPTDRFDNPLADKNSVQLSSFFNNNQDVENIELDRFIAWKRYYTQTKTGLYLLSAKFQNASSKEINVFIRASFPKNFKITSSMAHFFADGNQLLKLTSAVIVDGYNNIVEDGTLVNFVIRSSVGKVMMVQGTTIRGVAIAKIIHPERPSSWSIQAYVDGIANSNELSFTFEPALSDLNYTFSKDRQELKVGPLISFLDQLMPDGIFVYLHVYENNKYLKTIKKRTFRGGVSFEDALFKDAAKGYKFRIETMGIKKDIFLN